MTQVINRILNVLPSRETDNDWELSAAVGAGMLDSAGAIPATKDLRAGNDWWKIGDQENTGSCVGWATADGVLRYQFVKAGKIQPDELLSVRFMWMASKETDDYVERPTTFIEEAGTRIKAAFDVAQRYGCVPDSVLPLGSAKFYTGDTGEFYTAAAKYRIGSYHNLSLNKGSTLNSWRRWIAEVGPIATRLDVDDTWMNAKATAGNLDTYNEATAIGGHAVALVGYTNDRFIVRNSWGTSNWGKAGYGFASNAYAQKAFTEAYGVTI